MIEVLLSTYNGESFLRQQLESILYQTYPEWEILIRDDGSYDDTLAIIQEFCDLYPSKIKQLQGGKNIGCLRSFEILLQKSKSPYIMFSDQDDVWMPTKIEKAMDAMLKLESKISQAPCVICSDLCVVDAQLNLLNSSYWNYARINPLLLVKPNALAVNNYVTGCTILMNAMAKQIALPFGQMAVMHDAWIALSVVSNDGYIKTLSEANILYRQHNNNKVGAVSVKYGWQYFINKVMHIQHVLISNYNNYKQAHEIMKISFTCFWYNRIIYLLKR